MKHFMLYTISILLIIISCVTSKNLTTQNRITNAIFHNDKASVAKLVEYPFPQPYPLKPILNEQEFIQLYDRILSPDLCKSYKIPQQKTGITSHGEVYISKMERFGFVIKA